MEMEWVFVSLILIGLYMLEKVAGHLSEISNTLERIEENTQKVNLKSYDLD